MIVGKDYPGVTVCYFCHDGNGNFLMHKRSNNCRDEKGNWDIGAGTLEFGDTIEHTLHKEIKEEYSTDVLSHEFLGFRDVHREDDGKKTHWIAIDFKVLVDSKKVANGKPHKFNEVGWFTLASLPSRVHSQLHDFIKRYISRL